MRGQFIIGVMAGQVTTVIGTLCRSQHRVGPDAHHGRAVRTAAIPIGGISPNEQL
jgi:hypothetical protein